MTISAETPPTIAPMIEPARVCPACGFSPLPLEPGGAVVFGSSPEPLPPLVNETLPPEPDAEEVFSASPEPLKSGAKVVFSPSPEPLLVNVESGGEVVFGLSSFVNVESGGEVVFSLSPEPLESGGVGPSPLVRENVSVEGGPSKPSLLFALTLIAYIMRGRSPEIVNTLFSGLVPEIMMVSCSTSSESVLS